MLLVTFLYPSKPITTQPYLVIRRRYWWAFLTQICGLLKVVGANQGATALLPRPPVLVLFIMRPLCSPWPTHTAQGPKVQLGRPKSCLCERLRSPTSCAIKGFSVAFVPEKNVFSWLWTAWKIEQKYKFFNWKAQNIQLINQRLLIFSLNCIKLKIRRVNTVLLISAKSSWIKFKYLFSWSVITECDFSFWKLLLSFELFCYSAVASLAVDWPFSLNT